MLGAGFVYLGVISAVVGGISLVQPLSLLGIQTRPIAAVFVVLGMFLIVTGSALPARDRVTASHTLLDQFTPVYQFNEFHSRLIRAPKEQVFCAIESVTADEILLFRTLTWIRRFGRAGPEDILNAPERQPILAVATKTSFLLLAKEPNHEIVVGTLVVAPPGWRSSNHSTSESFRTLREPGFAFAAMNFVIEDANRSGCMLTTETRVYATDASARRRFAAYWRVIYPGSALIRRMWLRAIAWRAESSRS